jgi:dihydrofolate reductase
MGKIIAIEHLTLDGVMQSPGHADEDPRDGFRFGGWAAQRGHPLMQQVMGRHMSDNWALLAGRTTYVRFADFWPKQPPNPFTEALTSVRKYVASTTLEDPLPWQNSVLLRGDAVDAVARLKRDEAENLVIFGSGVLVRSLLRCKLVDELVLLFHPIVLGTGRRLFADPCAYAFDLEESATTPTGVTIEVYKPAA